MVLLLHICCINHEFFVCFPAVSDNQLRGSAYEANHTMDSNNTSVTPEFTFAEKFSISVLSIVLFITISVCVIDLCNKSRRKTDKRRVRRYTEEMDEESLIASY